MVTLFRLKAPHGNLTVVLRNPKPELFHFGDIWVYATDGEESGKSAGGRMCEHLDNEVASSAGVKVRVTFACQMFSRGKISINVHCVGFDRNLSIDECQVYVKLSAN